MEAKDMRQVELRQEWLEGRLHYIEHALETLLNGAQSRCRQCGEALGPGRLMSDPLPATLCLICQRNCGLNAKFHTP
jgi:RNA polymerase-binding transcription factor DksA